MSAHAHEHGHGHVHFDHHNIPVYDSRELIIREDILAKARELADMIATTEEVRLFQRAEKQIQANERVQTLIAQLKKRQQELVAFENTFKNEEMAAKIRKEMDELQDELDSIPIVQQFKQSQVDVNYMLQSIVSIIRDTVAEKVDLEAARPAEAPAAGGNGE